MIAYDLSNFPIFKNLSVLNNLSVLKKLCFGTIAIHLSKLSDGATVIEIKIQILLSTTNIIQLVALLSLLVTTQKRKCDVLATVVPTLLYGFLLFLGYLLTYLT